MKKEPAGASFLKKELIVLLVVALAAGSIFFPWFHIYFIKNISGSPTSTLQGSYSGTFVEGGWLGLSLSIFCLILVYLKNKWGGLFAAGNTLVGMAYLLGWVKLTSKFTSEKATQAQIQLKIEPQAGLYFFIVCSLLSTILLLQKRR
jgi:hypothetical protein